MSTKYSRIARVSLDFDQLLSIGGKYNNEGLPNDEVVVMVVDDGGNTAVGVDLQIGWGLVLSAVEI